VNQITAAARTRVATARTATLTRLLANLPPGDPTRQQIADSVAAAFEPMMTSAVEQALSDSTAVLEQSLNELKELVIVREGPLLEIAGAAAWAFPRDRWDSGTLDRLGLWATYSCEACRFLDDTPAGITPMLLLRYLRNLEGPDTETIDAGGRLAVSGARFGLSAEGVRRAFVGGSTMSPLWRVVGTVEFEVSDDAWILASFGRDSRTPTEGDLVARFGLKFNFVSDRYRSESLAGGPGR
jgi:hypothetical protein